MFDYRTQSKSIERLSSIDYAGIFGVFKSLLGRLIRYKNVKGKIHRVETFKISKKPMKW